MQRAPWLLVSLAAIAGCSASSSPPDGGSSSDAAKDATRDANQDGRTVGDAGSHGGADATGVGDGGHDGADAGFAFPAQSFLACDAVLPAGAGVLDVTDPKFGAVGDGVHDDTAAILKAIAYGSTGPALAAPWGGNYVYLPAGTYLVSDTIEKQVARSTLDAAVLGKCGSDAGTWDSGGHPDCFLGGLVLVGAGPERTTIKLVDHAAGFGAAALPKAVVTTTSSLFDGATNKNYAGLGEGNDAYSNFVECLTVDVGTGNAGAIGIDYLGNNGGAVRSVLLKAPTSSGVTGLSMTREWPGPALVENLWVQGFDVGVDLAQTTYTMTLDHVTLERPRRIGLRSADHALTIEDFTVVGAITPLTVTGADALTVLVGGAFSAGSLAPGDATEAFVNAGVAHLRNVATDGYATLLGAPSSATPTDGIYLANVRTRTALASFSLTPSDPPALPAVAIASPANVDDPTLWANVKDHGARGDGDTDDTAALELALKAAPVVYFPPGTYRVNANLAVPPTVRRIRSYLAALMPCGYGPDQCNGQSVERAAGFSINAGVLTFAATDAPVVVEKLNIANDGLGSQVGFEIGAGAYPVVLRDVWNAGATVQRDAAGGPLYVENYAGGPFAVSGTAPVYARQLNIEQATPAVTNAGAPLWILGMKSEGNVTWVETTAGGTTEVLGGLVYMVQPPADGMPVPALVNVDANTLASFAEAAFVAGASYTDYLESTVAGQTTQVTTEGLPVRGLGHIAPIVSSEPSP